MKAPILRRSFVVGCAIAIAIASLLILPAVRADDGAEVTLTGQVVCSGCWDEQEDRIANPYGTDGDMKCAARCSKRNITQSVAVWTNGKAELVVLEKGTFVLKEKDFLPFVAQQVEVRGTVRSDGGKRFVKVNDLRVVPEAAKTKP